MSPFCPVTNEAYIFPCVRRSCGPRESDDRPFRRCDRLVVWESNFCDGGSAKLTN